MSYFFFLFLGFTTPGPPGIVRNISPLSQNEIHGQNQTNNNNIQFTNNSNVSSRLHKSTNTGTTENVVTNHPKKSSTDMKKIEKN